MISEQKSELRKAKLLNEVLTEVINITEEELGRPIRKSMAPSDFKSRTN